MADDFTGIPTQLWLDLRDRLSATTWLTVALAAFTAALVLILVDKGVLSWADFRVTRG